MPFINIFLFREITDDNLYLNIHILFNIYLTIKSIYQIMDNVRNIAINAPRPTSPLPAVS